MTMWRYLLLLVALLGTSWLMLQAQAHQRAWEAASHCQVIGHTDPGTYPTTPRRAVLQCDSGIYERPTE